MEQYKLKKMTDKENKQPDQGEGHDQGNNQDSQSHDSSHNQENGSPKNSNGENGVAERIRAAINKSEEEKEQSIRMIDTSEYELPSVL